MGMLTRPPERVAVQDGSHGRWQGAESPEGVLGLPQLWLTSSVGQRPAGRMSDAEALPITSRELPAA